MPLDFGNLTYSQDRPQYVGQPIEEMRALQEKASQKYMENKAASDKLDIAINNLDLRDVDYDNKRRILENLKSTIKDTAEAGNWENAALVVQRAAKDVATDPLLRAAMQSRQAEIAYSKDINERKDLTATDKAKALFLSKIRNSKAVELDPVTGVPKNLYSGYNAPQSSVEIAKEMADFANGMKDSGGIIRDKSGNPIMRDLGNGSYKLMYGSYETIPLSEAMSVLATYGMTSPKIQDYLRFQKDYEDVTRFGLDAQGQPLYDAEGNLTQRDIDLNDLAQFGYKTNKKGELVDRKGKVIGNVNDFVTDPKKAKALYDSSWMNNTLQTLAYPGAEKVSFYKEDAHLVDDFAAQERLKASLKMKTDNYQPSFTSDFVVPGLNSKFTTAGDIQAGIKGTADSNQQELDRAMAHYQKGGFGKGVIDLLRLAAKGVDINEKDFHGAYTPDGKSHLEEARAYLLRIKQNNKTAQDIKDYNAKVLKEAGLDPKTDMSIEAIRKKLGEERFYQEAAKAIGSLGIPVSAGILKDNMAGKQGEAQKKEVEQLLNQVSDQIFINSTPEGKRYTEILKRNATQGTETVGLTTFSNTKVENALSKIVTSDVNMNGATSATYFGGPNHGKPVDYSSISDADPKSIRYGLNEKGELILAFRPKVDVEGKVQGPYVQIPAPAGVLSYLIEQGDMTAADYMLSQKISTISSSNNHVGTIPITNALGEKADIHISAPFKTDADSSPGGDAVYTVVAPTADVPRGKVYQFKDKVEVMDFIKNYVTKFNQAQQ